jgi:hypothetical protein
MLDFKSDIDIRDCKAANGYVHYLIARQNLAPICLGSKLSTEEQRLVDEMTLVCKAIEAFLPECEPQHLRSYVQNYAILYPFAYLNPVNSTALKEVDSRILEAWQAGNDKIAAIEVYDIIARRLADVSPELKAWYQRKQAEYFLELDKEGRFTCVSPAENYRLLVSLANDGIWQRYPDSRYNKEEVSIANFSDDYKSFDNETLCAYYQFLKEYDLDVPSFHHRMMREAEIVGELSNRPELDAYDREGYALDLQAIGSYLSVYFEKEIENLTLLMRKSKVDSRYLPELKMRFETLVEEMRVQGENRSSGKHHSILGDEASNAETCNSLPISPKALSQLRTVKSICKV